MYWQYIDYESLAFQRYGAILVVIGIFLDGQLLLRDKDGELTLNSSQLVIPSKCELKEYRSLRYRFSLMRPGSGLFLIIIGTLIWAFGDFLFKC